MVKWKLFILVFLSTLFLLYSFYPTYFEFSKRNQIERSREFILEHNFYWPDFNLYLSKIRQGTNGQFIAKERYTSEPHTGSLIQEFYLAVGVVGKILHLDPNSSYQLARFILSPLLFIVIALFCIYLFKGILWPSISLIIISISGSFPRFFSDAQGTHVGRFMEWWSNIDALQRLTFLPHIIFGQVGSFLLLYLLTLRKKPIPMKQFLLLTILGNAVGITFPPSLITLDGVLLILSGIRFFKNKHHQIDQNKVLFILFTLPSLLYIFFITRSLPWSSLVDFHRTHPMMIPFDQYILGTGPVFFLGILGALIAIIKRKKSFYPLILWVTVTMLCASFFSVIKEQSPLRFTQTGLFIPLGILTTYFFWEMYSQIRNRDMVMNMKEILLAVYILSITFYIIENLFMMTVSMKWQTEFITQRIGASIPLVPAPPQTMYPLKTWMDGIRWLKDNTKREDVVLAEITAGNYIPAYSGNTVYFGQSNTVDYERKAAEVDQFFRGKMSQQQAEIFLKNGNVKYIFFSIQEKEKSGGKSLNRLYPFLKSIFSNPDVIIYSF